jgi:hypothetical protein
VLVEGMTARQDLSPALGEARRSLGPRQDSRAGLNLPSKIIESSSGTAPSRARRGGDVRGDLREARGIRADMEQSLRRIRINAGAQAPEEAVGATIATAKTIRVTGRPTGTGQAVDSAGDLGAVRATGGGETRHLEEVAALGERHHHPSRQEEVRRRSRWAANGRIRWICSGADQRDERHRQSGYQSPGKSVKNGGWPYFDGTFKEYPSFRKFRTYQANYHQATPQRELAQMFRENCLPDKIALRVRKAEDMLTTWRIMDAVYYNPLAIIKDLMQEIKAVPEFREDDSEKMMEYYMLLQSHIAEADKADVGAMLLIPANIADMTRILPYAEGKRWRDQLGRIHLLDIGNGFSNFVDRRLEYTTTQVANCERLVLPKPIPLKAHANRSPSTERHPSRGDCGGSVS